MADDLNVWLTLAPGAFGLLGTIIGGLLTWGVQHSVAEREKVGKRRVLEIALSAEVDSYLDLMEHRNHAENVQAMIAANRGGVHTLPKGWITEEEKRSSVFPIFDANLECLGLLDGGMLKDLATFHRRVAGVRATIIQAAEGGYDDTPAPLVADIMERELELWRNAVALGRSVARSLRDSADN